MARNAKNEVSIGYWMLALLITAIPLVNLIVVPLLAFSGNDATKKNYYRAIIIWFIIIVLVQVAFIAAGFWPMIIAKVQSWVK